MFGQWHLKHENKVQHQILSPFLRAHIVKSHILKYKAGDYNLGEIITMAINGNYTLTKNANRCYKLSKTD